MENILNFKKIGAVSRAVLLVFVLLAGMFTVAVISSSAAYALDSDSPTAAIGTTNELIVHGAAAEGGALGGGAGGWGDAPAAGPIRDCWNYVDINNETKSGCDVRFKVSSYFDSFGGKGGDWYGCGVKSVNGFEIPPEGVVVAVPWRLTGFTSAGLPYYEQQATTFTCVYSSSAIVQSPIQNCILSYTAGIDRTANSRLGTAARVKSDSQTIATTASIIDNPDNCKTTYKANTNYNPPTNQNAWGQYVATSNISYAECRKATTTFGGKSTVLAKCDAPKNKPGVKGYLTIWCGGFTPALIQKSWSASDCYSLGLYSCSIPTPATYNSLSGTVQGIRDGKNSTLQWGTPQLSSGIRNSSNWKTKTDIVGGSTPYNASYGANDKNKQLFFSDNVTFGTWMGGGQRLSQNLAFYTAGNTGSPFSMVREYKYDAQFLTKTTHIGSYDITTGAILASAGQAWTSDYNVPCGPQGSPKINVIRAIGDKVG